MKPSPDLGLLLLHALPFDSRMWKNQRHIMPGSTVAPDLYAFGDDIKQWAAKSLDAVSHDRLIVVGCSVGGSCALEVMKRAHDRVAAAVLIGSKARCDPDPVALAQACRIIEDQGVAAAWDRYWRPLFGHDPAGPIARAARQIAMTQSSHGLVNGLRAFHLRDSCEDAVRRTSCPIHVITGSHDTLPGLTYARHLAGLSELARLHVIADCGHYVPMMQPKTLNQIIKGVINSVSTD